MKPKLTITGGISRKQATDEHGNHWTQFEVDTSAEQWPGECTECGTQIMEGWLCLDGGEECCNGCVEITGEKDNE